VGTIARAVGALFDNRPGFAGSLSVPRSCPVCWRLSSAEHRALIAALICGESLYSIRKRFRVSAMAVSRHWTGCMFKIDRTLRERSLALGAHRLSRQLVRDAPPVYATAIKAWLAGGRLAR
jgi:hypothetical protein